MFSCLVAWIWGIAFSCAGADWTGDFLQTKNHEEFRGLHPVEWDWLRQDCGESPEPRKIGRDTVRRVIDEAGKEKDRLDREMEALLQEGPSDGDPRWLTLYSHACEARRAHRLTKLVTVAPSVAFVKRRSVRPSFFAYTEGQSDAQAERHFLPDSALVRMTFDQTRARFETLLEDKTGVIRDPAVSWDGKRIAFAWKKALNEDDYHLYEMDLTSRGVRQVTQGVGVADYEPAYLPNGDLVFSSTRCVQTVDCFWTEVSNLYSCDPEGKNIRRLGFDQVHTVYPQVLDDGRVIYTRWDYNDRSQVFPQPLFQMNPDGSGQAEFYGNNSWFPTTIAHARGIPGTSKVLAILCGHHTSQAGKLAVIDPSLGRQENQGVKLVSPLREAKAERIDAYGQEGELFAYPYPLGEREWLVSYAPDGWNQAGKRHGDADFGLYWMDIDGRRELLACDPQMPCLQAVSLTPRAKPTVRPSVVDYSRDFATYYMQDIYQGGGLEGVERGSIRKLRVVSLDFRPAGIRSNHSHGPGGGALISTPVSIGNGAWDVKRVLGETPVNEDGSAFFIVPARRPVYFQAIDERGRAVQTMRSWSTLQPGESASCVGCHESKNSAPPPGGLTLAMRKPPLRLEAFHGPERGFSFNKEIQPILDRQCVRCHNDHQPFQVLAKDGGPALFDQAPEVRSARRESAFSLSGDRIRDEFAGREWSESYLALTGATREKLADADGPFRGKPDGRVVNWISSQSVPTALPARSAGSTRSELLAMLDKGHYDVRLSREEYEKIACWIDLLVPFCGDYTEANIWTPAEMEKFRRYEEKRQAMDRVELDAVKRFMTNSP